jgi:hypothetical protein
MPMQHCPDQPSKHDGKGAFARMHHGLPICASGGRFDATAATPLACAPESTGTAWQPDTSEHQGLMSMSGDWTVSAAILQSTSCRMRWHPRMAVITRPERLGSCV